MMIFKYKGIEKEFIIDGGNSYNLIIENPRYLYYFLKDIINSNEETIVLSKDYKLISFNKKAIVIENLYNFEINNKKILCSFYKLIEEKYNKLEYTKYIDDINILINKIFYDLNLELDVSIDYKDTIVLKDLLNTVELKVLDESKTILEKLILYIKLINNISNIKIVFIPFLNSFLDKNEIKLLQEELSLMEICLFNISSYDQNITNFEKTIVDYDLCEI